MHEYYREREQQQQHRRWTVPGDSEREYTRQGWQRVEVRAAFHAPSQGARGAHEEEITVTKTGE